MTSQALVEDLARWLYERDYMRRSLPPEVRIPDDYLNEAAVFLAGPLGQRLQRAKLKTVEELFAGGPDTSCRTTWPDVGGGPVECVEVPLAELQRVLDGAS
jgi:hypothetical protein